MVETTRIHVRLIPTIIMCYLLVGMSCRTFSSEAWRTFSLLTAVNLSPIKTPARAAGLPKYADCRSTEREREMDGQIISHIIPTYTETIAVYTYTAQDTQ